MAEVQSTNERLKEITEGIEQGIRELFESDRYRRYLSVMSRFHRYSVNNTMLIYMQRPDATLVAGFNKWKDSFGRYVKAGEKGIKIIAPAPFKKTVERIKLDPETRVPLLDEDGRAIREEKEIQIPVFKVVSVFDVSQTDGKPLPQLSSTLTGKVERYDIFMEALRRSSPVPIQFKPLAESLDGYFDPEAQSITIREGMSEVQTVCAAIHEIAHSRLHNYNKMAELAAAEGESTEPPPHKDRHTEEVEAESVSYSVCKYYGIETGENSFGYIASWSKGKELKELRASLETISKTASGLIDSIDGHFKVICKERGVALDSPEKQEPQEVQKAPAQASPPPAQTESKKPGPNKDRTEALYVVDGSKYLHLQATDGGYDYTIYDKETMKALDGGRFDEPNTPLSSACFMICADHKIGESSIQYAPLELVETLQEANVLPEPAQPPMEQSAAPTKELDTYPVPDEAVNVSDLEALGYMNGDLLPLTKEKAMTFFENGFTVYDVFKSGVVAMCMEREDIETMAPDGLYGITHEEWEDSPEFVFAVKERMAHQEEREAAFLNYPGDCYAIYQVRQGEDTRDIRYEPLERLTAMGLTPDRQNYELVYTGTLDEGASLGELWEKFNLDHPADYQHPSMSVSDIVALKRNGDVTYHYCDSVGFRELPGFNPLKTAEELVEDDPNMIDGIINNGPKQPAVAELEEQAKSGHPISLMDLADAVHREQAGKKPSVREKLTRQPTPRQAKKSASRGRQEREL